MGGNPCGNTLLDGVQLIGGDVGPDHLAVSGVFLLVWPRRGSRQIKPEVGLNVVVRNSLTDGVEYAERGLRGYTSLLGSLAIPGGGQFHVAGKAFAAVAIECGEMHFSWDETLLGGLAIPLSGCFVGFTGLGDIVQRCGVCSVALTHGDPGGGIAGVCIIQQGGSMEGACAEAGSSAVARIIVSASCFW